MAFKFYAHSIQIMGNELCEQLELWGTNYAKKTISFRNHR